MKILNESFYVSFFLIFLPLLFMSTNVSSSNIEHQRWSFDFEDCTVSDALRQMARVTTIEIVTNKNGGKELSRKSYRDQTIDQILKDIFRKESCAMIWRYGDSGLASIDIWVFNGGGGGRLHPERIAKQGRANLRDNAVRRKVDSKSKIVRRESPNIRKNGSFPFQKNPNDHINVSKEAIATIRSKVSAGGSRGKSDSLARATSDVSESQGIQVTTAAPPPMPQERLGLEPPPMPPGFSD